MNEITYTDKVALNENASIPDINKVKASDMNEIKNVVNTNSQTSSNNFGLETSTWTSSGTYAIGDIVVYNDNTYKNLTGTNTSITPNQDSTNWQVIPLIVNEQNNSKKNAYSCDYVNKALVETYSTNEVKTNKVWIDGKPIYRKVLIFPEGTGQTTPRNYALSDFGIDNNEEIYITNPSYYSFTGTSRRYPFPYNDGNAFACYVDGYNLTIQLGYIDIANAKVVITLEYTKTTD